MRALVLVLPLLAACGERFYVGAETCDSEFLSWTGGLTYHLLQGKGDGTFDYDPEGAVEEQITGGYDFQSGVFGWTTTYNALHYNTTSVIAGIGYAKTDGDLDIEYSVTTTDIAGDTFSYGVREKRIGCEVTRRLDFGDSVSWHFGTYVDGVYQYRDVSDQDGDDWVATGTMSPDLTWTESVDFSQPGFDYASTTVGDADGYSREDFEENSSDTVYAGYYENFLDGATHVYYTVDGGAVWDYTTDYLGDGTGTYVDGATECDLTFTEGACRYDCGGTDTGSC